MLKSKNKVIVISMGDPEGIGPEVTAKAIKRLSPTFNGRIVIVGSRRVMLKWLKRIPAFVSIIDVPYKNAGEGSLKFLDAAIELVKQGVADGIVTAPLSKERVAVYKSGFKGHTEYLAKSFDVEHVDMMFVANTMRTVIVTRHEPINMLSKLITTKKVVESIKLTHQSLVNIFKIKNPKIAILGLNPHAGENGLMGMEEVKAINPAIKQVTKLGWHVKGPFPADTFFAKYFLLRGKADVISFDAIIAMYHDQGLIPMKTLYFKDVVNMTIGLPVVRTCPAHGTAFDIAGKNIADPSSMIASIKLAFQLVQ